MALNHSTAQLTVSTQYHPSEGLSPKKANKVCQFFTDGKKHAQRGPNAERWKDRSYLWNSISREVIWIHFSWQAWLACSSILLHIITTSGNRPIVGV